MKRVYLDFNATTPVEPTVLDAMLPYFSTEFANAASIHAPGQKARAAVETAANKWPRSSAPAPRKSSSQRRHGIRQPRHLRIVSSSFPSFTSSTSSTSSRHIITTAIEHEAVLNACQALEKEGVRVTYLSTDREGQIDLEELRRAIRPKPFLSLSCTPTTSSAPSSHSKKSAASPQKPTSIPHRCRAIRRQNPHRRQRVSTRSSFPLRPQNYAPKGIGALYVRGGTRLRQLLYGGHHQRGFRPVQKTSQAS